MSFASLLNQSITHYPKTSFDKYGREVDGAAVAYKARVQEVTKSRLLPNGDVTTIDAVCFLFGDPSINIHDRIDYGGTKYRVFGRKTGVDRNGAVHHIQLELQKTI